MGLDIAECRALEIAAVCAGVALVETFARDHVEDLAGGATYTPADPGFYSSGGEGEDFRYELQDGGAVWRQLVDEVWGCDSVISDGTNFRIFNSDPAASELVVMRYHITGTYERYYTADMAAGATYVPADPGYFSHASEGNDKVVCEYQYNANWWLWYIYSGIAGNFGTSTAIGDGSHLRYRNIRPADATWVVIMRAVPG